MKTGADYKVADGGWWRLADGRLWRLAVPPQSRHLVDTMCTRETHDTSDDSIDRVRNPGFGNCTLKTNTHPITPTRDDQAPEITSDHHFRSCIEQSYIMDIMEGWLSDTIQKDLDQVLGAASCQPSATLNRAHEDDGSNLRTKTSKPGVVQIVKVSSLRVIQSCCCSESTLTFD